VRRPVRTSGARRARTASAGARRPLMPGQAGVPVTARPESGPDLVLADPIKELVPRHVPHPGIEQDEPEGASGADNLGDRGLPRLR